jgi:hypothetical protein
VITRDLLNQTNESLTAVYVVGGKQRNPRTLRDGQERWQGYDKGLALHVDLRSGTVSTCLEYVSREDAVAGSDAAISFQASTLEGNRLYTCTETEVIVYALPSFELLHYVSLPWFNDVHHVRPSPSGNIVVANAGLEMVLEITTSGDVVNVWNALGEDPWERFDPARDYRKVSTKPHRAHPNFTFYLDFERWATRFHQGDAVSLPVPGRSVWLSDERIHDGVLHDGRLYFTTVDGKIVIVDADTLRVMETVDLTRFHPDRTLLGWCRGVLVDEDRIWVGFSRIRPTQFRENVSWVARGFRREKPTHIACYDLQWRACLAEINLEPAGLSALYSILPAFGPPVALRSTDLEGAAP